MHKLLARYLLKKLLGHSQLDGPLQIKCDPTLRVGSRAAGRNALNAHHAGAPGLQYQLAVLPKSPRLDPVSVTFAYDLMDMQLG